MRRANLIGCLVLSILLISPVTTWAGSCPEGQEWNDRTELCVGSKTSSSKKSTKVDIKSFKITKPIGLFDANARREALDGNPELAS